MSEVTVVLEFQRSAGEVALCASRQRGPAESAATDTSAELRGIMRLVPFLIGAMTLDPRPAR